MSDDEYFYLQPGFDLNTLTVPRLRSILVAHDVSYPASSKKPQLIEIVNDEILPKARKLLSARARTKRTSRGITDVPSSQDGTLDGDEDEDEELMPPPPVPKTPRSRKSKSNMTAEAATPSTSRRSRTPGGRATSSKHPRASDTETDAEKPRPSARKTRKSQPGPTPVGRTPSVKISEPDARIKRESLEAGESPFSDENPFQSGSSPIPESRRISSTSRNRKSLGTSDRRKSTSQRRQTTSPSIKQEDGFTAPSRSTFEFPVTGLGYEDGIEPSEEFTPEAAQELEAAKADGQVVRKRTSALVRRKKKAPASTALKATPWAILTMLGAALGAWYRQEKINVGYCGVGEPAWSLASNPHIPQWVHENLQPACEPCPPHAFCYPEMGVKCEDDFLLTPHPLSLRGAVPLVPTCEPDSEKLKRVKAVADKAVEELRQRRAAYECGTEVEKVTAGSSSPTEEVKIVTKSGQEILEVPEETLKQVVSKMKRKGMSDAEFEDLWRPALGDIIDRDEIVVMRDGSGRAVLSSTSFARLPFTCSVRRSLRRTISRNRGPLSILILIFGTIIYIRQRITSYKQATAQIPNLVATTLDRLATQAAMKEDNRVSEGFISIGQLRDDVLRNVFSARERERVWKGVRAIVEGNSNVRTATREGGKTGEWSKVWEWIGPVHLAPGLGGRHSDGFITDSGRASPEARNSNTGKEAVENRKWDEGRPIY